MGQSRRRGIRGVERAAATAAAVSLATIGLLTACSGGEPPVQTVVVTVTPTPKPTPTPTPTPTPPPVAAPEPAPPAPPVPNAPAPEVVPGPAVDLGPIPGAMGTPVLDGDGMPVRYTVVSGDSFFDIAQRFDLPQQQLLRMNPQITNFGETVYIGDQINLDWTKVGLG